MVTDGQIEHTNKAAEDNHRKPVFADAVVADDYSNLKQRVLLLNSGCCG